MLNSRPLEAQQNRNHHHAYPEREAAHHHRQPPPKTIGVQSWIEGADNEHRLDAAAEDQRQIPRQADVLFKCGRNEILRQSAR